MYTHTVYETTQDPYGKDPYGKNKCSNCFRETVLRIYDGLFSFFGISTYKKECFLLKIITFSTLLI